MVMELEKQSLTTFIFFFLTTDFLVVAAFLVAIGFALVVGFAAGLRSR
jgi:hypothetical protein